MGRTDTWAMDDYAIYIEIKTIYMYNQLGKFYFLLTTLRPWYNIYET